MDITTIGFDLAKTVFQVHGADGEGRAVLRRKLGRGKVLAFFAGLPACLVGMEACASAHYWARELQALGHEVRLIPPQYVRPFVKTNKNDAADAEAICEAVTRPTMRFAAAKSAEQQSVLMLHRARELLVRQRTMVIPPGGTCGRLLQSARQSGAIHQGRQERDQMDAAVVPQVPRQCRPAPASHPGLQSRQLHADTGFAEGGGTLVSDHTTGNVGEDRCQSGQSWPVRHVPIGRGCRPKKLVPKNLEFD